jgi:hypothetical protein
VAAAEGGNESPDGFGSSGVEITLEVGAVTVGKDGNVVVVAAVEDEGVGGNRVSVGIFGEVAEDTLFEGTVINEPEAALLGFGGDEGGSVWVFDT